MKIKEIKAKSILVISKLPETDYVVNPYTGCPHACTYCYAKFMSRITKHEEPWGTYCDVKINLPEVLEKELQKARKARIFLSSVTDPYNPLDRKYELTRRALELIAKYQFPVSILTKSSLVLRDIDILSKIKECEVGLTITSLDDKVRKLFEPFSSPIEDRINALETLHNKRIRTYAFIGPILPGLTDVEGIINRLKKTVDFFYFENLNLKGNNKKVFLKIIKNNHPHLLALYEDIYINKNLEFWENIEKELQEQAKTEKLDLRIYFHH